MAERALTCPQCSAPLTASRFTRSAVCPYCGSTVVLDDRRTVPAARFREAHRVWNAPESHGYTHWFTVGDSHWAPETLAAHGEVSDVYFARRARWPTERVVLKILRDPADRGRFDHEWEVLTALQKSTARGAAEFTRRLPRPVVHGEVHGEVRGGTAALGLDRAAGFVHTFEAVRRAYPRGIEPRASIWIWRRILEVLAFLHASGVVHGAVLPPHLLVEQGEHGVRLVGYGRAGAPGSPLAPAPPGWEAFYPEALGASPRLAPAVDLALSARAVAVLLGADPAQGDLPEAVPEPLAAVVAEAAAWDGPLPGFDAWALRQRLGRLADAVFGPPVFCPLALPAERGGKVST